MPLRLVRYGRPSFVDKDEANVGAQGNSGRAEESPDPTFLTQGGPSHRSSSSTSKLFSEALAGKKSVHNG